MDGNVLVEMGINVCEIEQRDEICRTLRVCTIGGRTIWPSKLLIDNAARQDRKGQTKTRVSGAGMYSSL